MTGRTEVDALSFGVEHEGVLHTEFELRLPTVGDNIAAIEQTGGQSGMRVNVYMLAQSLVRLGTIPREKITGELLESGLADDDYDVLVEAQARLKKRLKRSSDSLHTSAAPASSLAGTDTGNATSAP